MRAVPRHLLLRFLVLVAIVVTGFAVLRWTPIAQYLTVAHVSALLDQLRDLWWAPAALIVSYIVGRLAGASGTLLLLTFIPPIWTARKRRERYRELCARRQMRVIPSPAPLPPPAGQPAAPLR